MSVSVVTASIAVVSLPGVRSRCSPLGLLLLVSASVVTVSNGVSTAVVAVVALFGVTPFPGVLGLLSSLWCSSGSVDRCDGAVQSKADRWELGVNARLL